MKKNNKKKQKPDIIKKVKNIFGNIKSMNYKDYAKTNILFITFVLTSLFNSTLLRYLTIKNYFDIKPILCDLGCILIIGSFVYLFKPTKQIFYILGISILFTLICIINSVYFTFYMSFASVSLLATSLFVVDVGDAIVENVLNIKDFIFLFQIVIVLVVNHILNKKSYYKSLVGVEKGKRLFTTTLLTSVAIIAICFSTMTSIEYGRLKKQWNREFLVSRFGIFLYQANDIVKSVEPRFNALFGYDSAYKTFREFYEEKEAEVIPSNKYTDIFKGKNVIAIHAESIMTDVMYREFNGVEVSPVLNKLAKEGIYFSNFYSQVSVGTSSDTEFTIASSLLPVSNGTVFVNYWDREYESMYNHYRDLGYYTASFHGNNATFWNRLVMHKNIGYDKFYSKSSYDIDEKIGLGLSDASFFNQSAIKLKEIANKNKNFFATYITLTNHTPFSCLENYGEFDVDIKVSKEDEEGNIVEESLPFLEETTLGNYYKSVRYADQAMGDFFDKLDEDGLLDNTVIIIYGDHDARLPRKEYQYRDNYNKETGEQLDKDDLEYDKKDYYWYELNRKVPLIIWTKDKQFNKEVTKVTGMYNVAPTLANMFGFKMKYNLGKDIFSIEDNIVVFPNGNWVTDDMYYNAQKEEYLLLKDSIVSEEDITNNKEHANRLLEVSNSLIMYDLIKKSNNGELNGE